MLDKEAFDRFFRQPLLWFLITVVVSCGFVVAQFSTVDHRSTSFTEFFNLTDNILAGILVSFIFFFLVVHLPEKQRRNRLRKNFSQYYLSIKEDLIWQIVFSSIEGGRHDLETTSEQIAQLMDVKAFRECFSGGRESNEGWYAFANQMSKDTPQFQEIMLLLSQLKVHVEYVLMQDVFEDLGLLSFFSWLRNHLIRLERTDSSDWEKGSLLRFLYELLAGWDPINGYREFDFIEMQAGKIL